MQTVKNQIKNAENKVFEMKNQINHMVMLVNRVGTRLESCRKIAEADDEVIQRLENIEDDIDGMMRAVSDFSGKADEIMTVVLDIRDEKIPDSGSEEGADSDV